MDGEVGRKREKRREEVVVEEEEAHAKAKVRWGWSSPVHALGHEFVALDFGDERRWEPASNLLHSLNGHRCLSCNLLALALAVVSIEVDVVRRLRFFSVISQISGSLHKQIAD